VTSEDKLYRATFPVAKLPDGQQALVPRLCLLPDNRLWFIVGFGWAGYLNEKNVLVPVYLIKNEHEDTVVGSELGLNVPDGGKYSGPLVMGGNEYGRSMRKRARRRNGRGPLLAQGKAACDYLEKPDERQKGR